ncbi:hypothetical protein H010_13716 [Hydrogenophaga taeniospiralis CCUG 15921]|uniref:Uncharacterized protein n=1 Tax=Hydrogenophaga taeniospiralis CCUG 15921 TaxID=1281780 RepID=A0A9X4NSD3_9BURK|nr:hypothetical protein [Hydrogenophaga taeniospiralis CCUG 15921]
MRTWWIRVCLGFAALAGAFSTLQLRHWWPDSLMPRQPLCANGQRLAVYGLASTPSVQYPTGQTFQVRVRAP